MKGEISLSNNQFCVLPYVDFQQPFSFADFDIWPNTTEHWQTYYNKDNTNFLQRYVDENGKSIKDIYVITSLTLGVPYARWEALIHTLHFIASYDSSRILRAFADDFYFEVWEEPTVNKQNSSYTIVDKFVRTYVSAAAQERIYPNRHISVRKRVGIDPQSDVFQYFEKQFKSNWSFHLFRSLSFFFRTQYRNILYFPEMIDVVNFCSAFQTFLRVLETQDLKRVISRELIKQMSDLNLPKKTEQKLKRWMETFYDLRCLYIHGVDINDNSFVHLNQRHIDIAEQVFKILVLNSFQTYKTGVLDLDYIYRRRLWGIFNSQETFDSLVKFLSKKGAKDCLTSLEVNKSSNFASLARDSFDLREEIITFDNKNRLRQALVTLTYLLEHLYEVYKDKSGKFYTEPLKKIIDVARRAKNEEERIKTFLCVNVRTEDPENRREEVLFKDSADLGDLLRVFSITRDVYQDYNRL